MPKSMLLTAILGAIALSPDARAQDSKKSAAVLTPADKLNWVNAPGMQGVQIATVEGDATKGAHHSLIKFASGFAAPMHHHTANHFVTVISGTVVLTVDGREQRLAAPAFFSFSGKKPHATRCLAGVDCILSLDARGPWDVVPEDKAAAKE